MQELSESLEQLPKLCLLSAAFVVYLSDQPEDKRRQTIDEWVKTLGVKEFNLKR